MKALGNKNMVLRETCKGWNHLFARAFETPFLSGSLVRELRALHVPGAKAIERPVDDGERIRVVSAGKIEEARMLQSHETCEVEIPVTHGVTGDVWPLVFRLPQPVVMGLTGAKRHVQRKMSGTVSSVQAALSRHVDDVLADPRVDPELHRQLREADVGRVELHAEAHFGEPRPLPSPKSERTVEADIEPTLKVIAKTAWSYAALVHGRMFWSRPEARRVLRTLKMTVPLPISVDAPSDLVAVIELPPPVGEAAVWRLGPNAVDSRLEAMGLEDSALGRANRRRRRALKRLSCRVTLYARPDLNLTEDVGRFREHRLSIIPGTSDGLSGTFVRVDLFGGYLAGLVRVLDRPVGERREDVISFRHAESDA